MRSASALALGVATACSVSDRPPLLGVEARRDAGVEAGPETFQPTAPTKLSCNLGPDGGVCACADQPLMGDPPNIYFVLDRSASMQIDSKWLTIVNVIGSLVVQLGPRANVGVAVFPDPHYNGCSTGIPVIALRRGDAPAGTKGPTANAVLGELGGLMANGGTPTATTLEALAPMLASLPGKTYVILATDGGPNCNAMADCTVAECELNIENTSPSCTAGGPIDCCMDPHYGDPQSCLDADPTIAAVTAIAQGGIPVYVVGVPGSAPYAALLNQLAFAGGTPRATAPNYYAVDTTDQTALTAALFGIAANITGTCTLTLDDTPPDPTLVNVFLGEQVLPQAGPDGWTLDGNTVTILGQSCQEIQTGAILDVRVVAGCPTFTR
jgi:hypothetical protein